MACKVVDDYEYDPNVPDEPLDTAAKAPKRQPFFASLSMQLYSRHGHETHAVASEAISTWLKDEVAACSA